MAVIDASPRATMAPVEIHPDQLYSAGIHPWDTTADIPESVWKDLEALLQRPEIVAVGECGVDLAGKGGMMFRQLQVMRRQIDLSEKLQKPMIVHCVKAEDVICGLRRDLKPTQPWIIHGFRRKPQSAAQLLRAGCWLSYGPSFNAESLIDTPLDRILAETDENPIAIDDVIIDLSRARGADLREQIAMNSAAVLGANLRF